MTYQSIYSLRDTWACFDEFTKRRYRQLYNRFQLGLGWNTVEQMLDQFKAEYGDEFGELRWNVFVWNGGLILGQEVFQGELVDVVYTSSPSLIILYDCINTGGCPVLQPLCEYLTFSNI